VVYSGLIMDGSKNLYGTTENGGADGKGSVFELPWSGSAYATAPTVLYSFTGGTDGKNPYGGLVMDGSGDIFGDTKSSTNSDGVIFELAAGATTTTTLYNFTGGNDGKEPLSSLVLDSNDDLIGVAQQGGAFSDGTLFELTKSGGSYSTTLTTLYAFHGGASAAEYPTGSVLIDSKGDIFGTEEKSGSGSDGGVFELASGATAITSLYQFSALTSGDNSDGANPWAGLLMNHGNLYGTAANGGTSGDGTIFEIPSTTQLVFAAQPSNTTAGTLPSLTVDVEDTYGNIITSDTSNVTLSVNSGPGALTGTVTVAAVNGVATFSSAALDTAGAYTLTASDTGDTSATTNSFTISAAIANKVAFSTGPSNVTAGVAESPSIVVDVEDQFGNIETSNSSNVTLAINTGSGTVSGTATVAAVNGVATFSNIILDTAATDTLQASDGSLTVANSSSFIVSAAASAQLAFEENPTNANAGATISPAVTVEVEDQFGNLVTTDSSNVTLSVNSGTGSLGGTLTKAAVNGVATFSNLSMTVAGAKTLLASDSTLSTAVSNSFTISAGSADLLGFSQQPTSVAVHTAVSPSITVDVEDQYGNLVTSSSATVALAVNSGPGSIGGTDSVSAVNGVATFSNVTFVTVGSYTLVATSSPLAAVDSTSFSVTPGGAHQVAFGTGPSNVTAGVANSPSIVVDVEDQYGNIETSDSSTVVLSINSGPGTIGGTDSVAAVNGVATFNNVVIDTAGSYTLLASDNSLSTAVSGSFTVSTAAASTIAFTQGPTNVTAGNANSPNIIADVEDQFGNVITSFSSTVSLSVHTGPGSLGGTDSVSAVNGVATFSNVVIDTAGNYTLTASGDSVTGNSSSFTVSPASAHELAYSQQPTSVSVGAAVNPAITVDVEDTFGNVITTDSSTVTLSIDTGPGAIGGTDSVAAVNGVATFSNVTFNTLGSYTLTASDGSLTTANSNSFTVDAISTKLAFSVQPSTVAAGSAISPSITVDVEDSIGGVVTSDSSNVTLSINSGPGSIGGTDTVAAVNGVATFSNVVLDTAGSYTLEATDSTLTAATSSSFTVTPGNASKVVYSTQPTSVTAGVANSPSIVVDVEDAFGNIETSNSSNVTLSVASGGGSVSGTATVAAVNGVATFSNAILDTAGTHTLLASDGALNSATSNSFTVSPAAADTFSYATQPASVAAGAAISPSIVVDVIDQFGNVVTSNTSTITLAVGTGPGSIGGTDSVAAVAGVATFSNVKFDTAGNYLIVASNNSLPVATSSSFTVSPTTASKLVYNQQPSTVTAGVAISPAITVDVEDQFGNIATSNTSNVTLAINTGPGSIGGTDTIAAVNGVATFSNIILDTAGNYTLAATDTGLTAADSSSFTVNPASATKLAYSTQPSNVSAGSAITPAIVVDVEDQFGNIVTSNTSNVTLAVNTGPGSIGGTDTVAAVAGVATFSDVTFNTEGSYTLAATDTGLTTADSSSFTVNSGTAAKLVINQEPTSATAGNAISPSITVDVEDAFGNIMTSNSSDVTLAVHTGPGSIGGTDTVAAVNGVATFTNVVIDTAGSYTLAATDSSLTAADSSSFTISPAAASKLAYTTEPVQTLVGTAVTPAMTVAVEDQFGNVITSNTSLISLSVESGPGTLNGTASANAVNGVATFNDVVINVDGTYVLTASDSGLTSANSSSFVVGSSGVATQLVILSSPSATWEYGPVTVKVALEDAFGNVVTNDPMAVTLNVTPTTALGGTLTENTVNGVATFSGLYADKTGSVTYSATGGDFTANPTSPIVAVGLTTPVRTRALINPAPFDPSYILHLEQYEGTQLAQQGPPNIEGSENPAVVKQSTTPAVAAAVQPPQTTQLQDNLKGIDSLLNG
jgi:uncharacterized repeat protein (TIGR03803 family)